MSHTIVAINNAATFCECCGKQNLKRVVWIRNDTTGETKHFGTTCALDPSKGFGIEKDIKKAVKKANDVVQSVHREYRQQGGGYEQTGNSFNPTNPALFNEIYKTISEQTKW